MEEKQVREVIRAMRALPFDVKFLVNGPNAAPFKREDVDTASYNLTQVGKDYEVEVVVDAGSLMNYIRERDDERDVFKREIGARKPSRKAPSDPGFDEVRVIRNDMGFTETVSKDEAESMIHPVRPDTLVDEP